MTIYPPRGRNSGAAMMVFPGGGYQVLAIDLEGSEICDWVTARGMTCVLLKYRVPQDWHKGGRHQAPAVQLALQDAQRAMGLIRRRADALGIDPHRIGVIGFSAGGHLAAAISNAGARTYPPADAADRESPRPDFAIPVYPGHLWSGEAMGLYRWNAISRTAPPTLLIHAMNDPVDDVRNSIAYALVLREAGVPAEVHLYAEGGHAFGMRPTALAVTTDWPRRVEAWLHAIKVL
jgi:acetyl esterase/lipase